MNALKIWHSTGFTAQDGADVEVRISEGEVQVGFDGDHLVGLHASEAAALADILMAAARAAAPTEAT